MKHLFKQPLFYTTILSSLALGLIIASYVFGWTTPTQAPPNGNITLQTGASPAGSTGYIQFNAGSGALGGDANLFWDNINKRLGIGTTTPSEKLEVAGNIKISGTGNGIKFPDGTIQTTAASDGSVTITWSNYKHYFVTATKYDGNLGGLSGCDAKCNSDSNRISGKTYHCVRNSDSVWNVSPYILYNATIGSMYDKMQCWGFSCKGTYTSNHPAPSNKTYVFSIESSLGTYDITNYDYWNVNNVPASSASIWDTAIYAAANNCSATAGGWNQNTSSYYGFLCGGVYIAGKAFGSSCSNTVCNATASLLCVEN
jgi:hypothetical protein